MDDAKRRIGELEDEIKHRDRRIEGLRQEIDELRDLNRRMEENVEDASNVLESWKETFGMQETEDGCLTWKPFWEERSAIIDKHNKLVSLWNRYMPLIKQQPVGRPIAASEAQCAQVLRLSKAGKSLRAIADETSLGLNTVRTIVNKAAGTDRTTKKHWARIVPDRAAQLSWKRRKREGDALPRRVQRVVEQGKALIKESKGLGGMRLAA